MPINAPQIPLKRDVHVSWFGMQSLRYWRFKFCKNDKGSQANTGFVSTLSHHFAERFHKTKTGKAHVITPQRRGSQPTSLVFPPISTTPDRYKEPGTDSGAQSKMTSRDPSHFNSVPYGHRNSYNPFKIKNKIK